MKILCIADSADNKIWNNWGAVRHRFGDIGLILSAGDLHPGYLEFLVTMLNVPCLYVRGNHDMLYHEKPPQGCVCIEDDVIEIYENPESGHAVIVKKRPVTGIRQLLNMDARSKAGKVNTDDREKTVIVAGLGGSMRYREGRDMYTEKEMTRRVHRIERRLMPFMGTQDADTSSILLTHAPCLGYGDMDDLAHRGFACFNELLERWRPVYHCYGHVHMEYGVRNRETEHPSGTRLINVSGLCIIEV